MDLFLNEINSSKQKQFQIVKSNQVEAKYYHNTKLLLKLYNKVLWRINNNFKVIEDECIYSTGKKVDELVNNLLDAEMFVSEARLESRIQSIKDSREIIKLIDKALIMLRTYPDNEERYYWIIFKSYISTDKYTENDIIDFLCCSRATYFREKKKAIVTLSTILWGYLIPELSSEINNIDLIHSWYWLDTLLVLT